MNKHIETEIEINASAETVWNVLTDFESYCSWNPFVREISGDPKEGERLRVFIKPVDGRGMGFNPTILKADVNRELRWLGKLFIRGLFDGEHYFRIEPISENRVRFIHGENFSGVLVGLFAKGLDAGTAQGFIAMNGALKERSEENGAKPLRATVGGPLS